MQLTQNVSFMAAMLGAAGTAHRGDQRPGRYRVEEGTADHLTRPDSSINERSPALCFLITEKPPTQAETTPPVRLSFQNGVVLGDRVCRPCGGRQSVQGKGLAAATDMRETVKAVLPRSNLGESRDKTAPTTRNFAASVDHCCLSTKPVTAVRVRSACWLI